MPDPLTIDVGTFRDRPIGESIGPLPVQPATDDGTFKDAFIAFEGQHTAEQPATALPRAPDPDRLTGMIVAAVDMAPRHVVKLFQHCVKS